MMSPVLAEQYGFFFPPSSNPRGCRINVTRTAAIERRNGLYRIVSVDTERQGVNIYISPTGQIRVFKDAKELR
jgi:hypothetical protein